jgi:TolB-like protein
LAFYAELSRRKVPRVAIAYAVTAWLAMQIIDVVNEPMRLPDWFAATVLTVLIIGFPIVVLLAWAFDITPEGVKRTAAATPGESPTPTGRSRLDYLLFGLVAIGVAWLFYRTEFSEQPPPAATVAPRPAASSVLENSVAVLPFHNLSPDPNNAYFAAGIHEEVLNQLAKIKALAVISRTSVLSYIDTDKSMQVIAHELNVETVMEGSVRYAGNRVRITAQLIDAKTGAHLWSETYDRDLDDIFAIQSDIAKQISTALKIEFSVEELESISVRTTENMQAYAEYVRAMSHLRDLDSTARIHAGLDAAIALDPNYAEALAAKAWLHGFEIQVPFGGAVITAESQRRNAELALEYASRATAIDANRAGAHLALSLVANYEHRWDDTFRHAERAYALNPNLLPIQASYSQRLNQRGRIAEANALYERAMSLDPSNWSVGYFFAWDLYWVELWDYAKDQMRQVIALAPDVPQGYIGLAWMAATSGDLDLALEVVRQAEQLPLSPNDHLNLALTYSKIGLKNDARRHLALRESDPNPMNSWAWFRVLNALGEEEAALDHLETAIETNFPAFAAEHLTFRSQHLFFDDIRDHPRFQAVLASLNVPSESSQSE